MHGADNNIRFTAVLILDNTLDHFPNFQRYHSTMKIIFLPPETTELRHPMY